MSPSVSFLLAFSLFRSLSRARTLSLSEQEPEAEIVLGASMAEAGLLLDGADDPSTSCFDAEWDDAHESWCSASYDEFETGFDYASLEAANKSCFGVTREHDRAVGTLCRNNMDYLMCHFCAPQQVRVLALSACARITAF